MRRRDKSFFRFKRDSREDKWDIYKAARNRCNQVICNAKRRHILQNFKSSSSSIWKFRGTLGIGKKQRFNNTIDLNDINRYFTSTTTLDLQTKCQTLNYFSGLTSPTI